MLSCAVDAKENRYVVQHSGSFLLADMNDNVHMHFEGTIAEKS